MWWLQCATPTAEGTCPNKGCPCCECAPPDAQVATPTGERPIASLEPGDLVYSADGQALRPVPVIELRRKRVTGHRVIRLVLATGRTIEMSAGHPTADGRRFGDLRPGDRLDGVTIERVTVEPYAHLYTYDVLPASASGTYVASGVLVGSTLHDRATCAGD